MIKHILEEIFSVSLSSFYNYLSIDPIEKPKFIKLPVFMQFIILCFIFFGMIAMYFEYSFGVIFFVLGICFLIQWFNCYFVYRNQQFLKIILELLILIIKKYFKK